MQHRLRTHGDQQFEAQRWQAQQARRETAAPAIRRSAARA